MKYFLTLILTYIIIQHGFSKTWKVGSTKTYTAPSEVATLVGDGDTVEIDAGIYNSDVAKWTANNLTLKGIGGMAHLKSNGTASGGKGIWVIAGNNTKVEYIEFSLCSVPDNNGAGIRLEGKNLTVSHCYFHDNQNGILAGKVNPSTVLIEYTEFGYNGFGDGFTHNLYINNIDTLIFRYNYSHHAKVGHELKSRANVNYILYNRLSDETTGTASRNIDLPNGGLAYIIGNIIEQGPETQNSNIIGYGLEGLSNTAPHEVYAINNTIVNNRVSGGSFFAFQAGTVLFKGYNNILAGNGSFVTGNFPSNLDTANNRVSTNISSFGFINASLYDYHVISSNSSVINSGKNSGSAHSFSLSPVKEYLHPNNEGTRCTSGTLDVGAFEYCVANIVYTKSNNLSIHPNPAKEFITINLLNTTAFKIEIYSSIGQHLLSISEKNVIDISNFATGIYLLIVKQGEGIYTTKLVKE